MEKKSASLTKVSGYTCSKALSMARLQRHSKTFCSKNFVLLLANLIFALLYVNSSNSGYDLPDIKGGRRFMKPCKYHLTNRMQTCY